MNTLETLVRRNYRLGQLYEQTGQPIPARASYIRFLQAWEEAEADLPQDDEARASLETLLAGCREPLSSRDAKPSSCCGFATMALARGPMQILEQP